MGDNLEFFKKFFLKNNWLEICMKLLLGSLDLSLYKF